MAAAGEKQLLLPTATPKQPDGLALISPSKQAVVWIKKAHAGSTAWVDECTENQFYYYCLLKKLKPLWHTTKILLLVVMLFEVPAQCVGPLQACQNLDTNAYSWPIAIVPLRVSCFIYIVLYSIILCRMKLREYALGAAYQFSGTRTIVASLGLIGATGGIFGFETFYVASFVCRPLLFLGCTKSIRKNLKEVLHAVPSFMDVLASLFITVFLFSCVGMVLFVDNAEGEHVFTNWRVAVSRMWILFTTNNDPNVFIPAYQTNRLYFFFFFFYLICMIYLLSNVLLAKVYDSYKSLLKADLKLQYDHQHVCIHKAFSQLAGKGHSHITKETWNEFFIEYCDPAIGGVQVEDPSDSKYNSWRANVILSVFHGMDMDKAKGINLEQYRTIMEVFLDREMYIPKRRPPKAQGGTENWHLTLYKFYTDGFKVGGYHIMWDKTMDVVILFGSLLSFYATFVFCQAHAAQPPPSDSLFAHMSLMNSPSYWMIFAMSLFYGFSLTVKIMGLGMERFWCRPEKAIQHRFDFFSVYALILAELLYMSVLKNTGMEKVILLLSLARVLRLVRYIKPLRQLCSIVVRLLPTYVQIASLLVVVFFVFASIGRLWFGGHIYSTNPALAGSSFAKSHFFAINFNDTPSALVSLFVFMIMNNFPTLCAGYNQAMGNYWATAFFIFFFVVCNLVVLNILMALILECLGVVSEIIDKEEARDDDLDDDVEQMASGAGERSAAFMLRQVLCSDEHHDKESTEGSDAESPTQSPITTEKSPQMGYGTMGGSPSLSRRRSQNLDDLEIDPELGGLRLPALPKAQAKAKGKLAKAMTLEDMEAAEEQKVKLARAKERALEDMQAVPKAKAKPKSKPFAALEATAPNTAEGAEPQVGHPKRRAAEAPM